MNRYQIDTMVQVRVLFTDVDTGNPADPTVVVLYLLDPSGVEQTVTAVIKSSVGAYFYEFTPSAAGTWTYKWQGTGTVVATSPDTRFVVISSPLIQ